MLLGHAAQLRGVPLAGGNEVTLAWDGSTSPDVTGFRIHYGPNSRGYTNSVTVGNLTSGTVAGLVSGETYYLAVTAYTAAGLESEYSAEVMYAPGGVTLRPVVAPGGVVTLLVSGRAGRTYGIEATENLMAWTSIGSVTLSAAGVGAFIDPAAGNFSRRFYRAQDSLP
jgi:hypothetical protein